VPGVFKVAEAEEGKSLNQEGSTNLVESKSSSTNLELEVLSRVDQLEGRMLVFKQFVVVK
jgi:hypothetical protein